MDVRSLNPGVASPPGSALRSSPIQTHGTDAVHADPDGRERDADVHEGSWWPAWEGWLAGQAGTVRAPPEPVIGSATAPGTSVLRR